MSLLDSRTEHGVSDFSTSILASLVFFSVFFSFVFAFVCLCVKVTNGILEWRSFLLPFFFFFVSSVSSSLHFPV